MIKIYINPVNPKIKKILIQTIEDILKAQGGELKVITTNEEGLPAEALAEAGSEFIIQLPVS